MSDFRAIVTLKALPMVQKGDEIVLDQLLDPPARGLDWAVLILEDDVPVRLVDLSADAARGLLPGVELQLDAKNQPILPRTKLGLPPVARPIIDAVASPRIEGYINLLPNRQEIEQVLARIEAVSDARARAWIGENGGGNFAEKKEEIKTLELRALQQKLMLLFWLAVVRPPFQGGRYIGVGDAGSGKTTLMLAEAEAMQTHGIPTAVMILGERPETRLDFKPKLFIRCPEGVSSGLMLAALIAFVSFCMRARDRGEIIHAFIDSLYEVATKLDAKMPAERLTSGGVSNMSKAIVKALFVLFGRAMLPDGRIGAAGITGAVLLALIDRAAGVWGATFERTANGKVWHTSKGLRDQAPPPYPRIDPTESGTRGSVIALLWGDVLDWLKNQPNARARILRAFDWHDPAGSFKKFVDDLRAEKEGAEQRELEEALNQRLNDAVHEITINLGPQKVLDWIVGILKKMAEHPNLTKVVEKAIDGLEEEIRQILANRAKQQQIREEGQESRQDDRQQNRGDQPHRPPHRDDRRR